MKIALVSTVKNEQRLLRDNLLYHHAIGVDRAFVYFDGTTDGGRASVADLDFVSVRNSVLPDELPPEPFLEKFVSQAGIHHTARQCLNTYHASLLCKKEGIQWLLSIDPDELVVPEGQPGLPDLGSYLLTVAPEVDLVQFKVLEALQCKMKYNSVFREETAFKTTHHFPGRWQKVTRKVYDPFEGKIRRFSWWYGQHLGKAVFRIGRGIIPRNVHRYQKVDGSKTIQQQRGWLLHYHAYDAQDFIKKYRNFAAHPDTFLSGNRVKDFKLLMRDVVNRSGMDNNALEAYFDQYLRFSEEKIKYLRSNHYLGFLKRKTPLLHDMPQVQEVFMKRIDRR